MDECLDVLWHLMFTLKGMLVKSSGTAAGSSSKCSVALLSNVYYTAGKIIISQILFRIDCCHFCSWQAEQIEASPIMSKGLRAGEGNYCKSRVWKFIGYLHTAWFVFSFSGVNVQNLSVTNLLICWFIQQFSPCNELISRVWNGKCYPLTINQLYYVSFLDEPYQNSDLTFVVFLYIFDVDARKREAALNED